MGRESACGRGAEQQGRRPELGADSCNLNRQDIGAWQPREELCSPAATFGKPDGWWCYEHLKCTAVQGISHLSLPCSLDLPWGHWELLNRTACCTPEVAAVLQPFPRGCGGFSKLEGPMQKGTVPFFLSPACVLVCSCPCARIYCGLCVFYTPFSKNALWVKTVGF